MPETPVDASPSAAALHEIASGVYAWIQPDGTWFINNAGAIAGPDGLIVIDTCATEERTRRFLDALDRDTAQAPIRAAANTHHHGDHTYGNSLLPSSAVLFGHPLMREELQRDFMIDTGRAVPFWEPVPEWGNVTKRLPDVTVATDVTIYAGQRRIELRHPGHHAHTCGDLIAWLPEERVVFTGDLIFHNCTPMIVMGSAMGALRAIDWLESLDPLTVVPGHGPLATDDEVGAAFDAHRRYYRFVIETAAAGSRDGLDPLAAARRAALGEFAGWGDPERIVLNLHRAYAEQHGRDVDIVQAFADAMAFHGGPLPCRVCCVSP